MIDRREWKKLSQEERLAIIEKDKTMHDRAMYWAIEEDDTDIVAHLLIWEESQLTTPLDSFLLDACTFTSPGSVRLLIEAGANVHAAEDFMLIRSCNVRGVEVLRLLLDAEPDFEKWDKRKYQLAIDHSCSCCYYGVMKFLKNYREMHSKKSAHA